MPNTLIKLPSPKELDKIRGARIRIGRIVEVTGAGQAVVDFEDNPTKPTVARTVIQVPDREALLNVNVLLAFENDDPALPIIIGLVHDQIISSSTDNTQLTKNGPERNAGISGRRIVIEAEEEIVMHCGKGSIVVNQNGKVSVKGKQVTSRASGANKIKGATVNIN